MWIAGFTVHLGQAVSIQKATARPLEARGTATAATADATAVTRGTAMKISEIKERAKTWGAPGIIPQITATATSKPCARPPDSRGGTMAGIAIQ
jgi:hypothetical protein